MARYREMEVFLAVCQAGSLAACARQLGLSVATVTRTLDALEARLQVTLLARGPRGVRLLPAGAAFAARCEAIFQQVAAAERSAAGLHAHPAGLLNLSAPLLMGDQLLAEIALDYLTAFPEMRLAFHAREDLPRLLEERIDIALVIGPLPDTSLFALPVGQVRPVLCAAPGYRPTAGRPRLACSTRSAAIRAAVLGAGPARCLSYEAYPDLAAGRLVLVAEEKQPAALPVYLIYREGPRADARVRTFLDFAAPRLRAHPALRG